MKLVCLLLLIFVVAVHSCGLDIMDGPCSCTTNSTSGSVLVDGDGCGNHLGDSCFCYVSDPEACKELDLDLE